jgi:L-ascorbate metabolism protein UlaG (beta-lactamase superfamily)
MRITHLGHSAVLVETDDARVLIDPGNFSDAWHGLTDLDAILITHIHPDHADPEQLPALVQANRHVKVYAEPSIVLAEEAGKFPEVGADGLAAGEQVVVGDLLVTGVGGQHAIIHRDIPQIGNVGYVLRSEGQPTLFHPGDSLTAVPDDVDILGVPLMGPWAAMKETIDFVRAVGALEGFPIHDGLLNERGRSLIYGRVVDMTGTRMTDLREATTHEF